MVYQQLLCLLIFISVVYGVVMALPPRFRHIALLVASYGMIGFISKWLAIFPLLSTAVVYGFARIMERTEQIALAEKPNLSKEEWKLRKKAMTRRKKHWLALGLVLNLGMLVGLKYINFLDSGLNGVLHLFGAGISIPMFRILLPLGISYYTLQSTGYLIDCFRGKYPAEHQFMKLALFVGYFPQLLEGPIGHYDQTGARMNAPLRFDFHQFTRGLQMILFGLFKKLVIADRLSILVSAVFGDPGAYSGYPVALAVIAFTFQLYAEFSGMIDLVRGVSQMYGIALEENFRRPFFSASVGEFWRRWHISLGTWFKEYVFYPVSMSKLFSRVNKKLRSRCSPFIQGFVPSAMALLCVWVLTGLWHGASMKYLIYGLYYCVVILAENLLGHLTEEKPLTKKPLWRAFGVARTFVLVNLGMLMFRADTLTAGWKMLCSIFSRASGEIWSAFQPAEAVVAVLSLLLLLWISLAQERGNSVRERIEKRPIALQYAVWIGFAIIIIVFGAYGLGYLPPDPIYGGF